MMTDFPDPPPPLAEPKGGITECVNKTLPGLLDVVERALPLGRFSLVFGEAGLHVNVPQCPLWFDGERVHCDLHPHSPYVNVVAVKQGNESDPRIVALVKALRSDKIKAYVAKQYVNGEVVLVTK